MRQVTGSYCLILISLAEQFLGAVAGYQPYFCRQTYNQEVVGKAVMLVSSWKQE